MALFSLWPLPDKFQVGRSVAQLLIFLAVADRGDSALRAKPRRIEKEILIISCNG